MAVDFFQRYSWSAKCLLAAAYNLNSNMSRSDGGKNCSVIETYSINYKRNQQHQSNRIIGCVTPKRTEDGNQRVNAGILKPVMRTKWCRPFQQQHNHWAVSAKWSLSPQLGTCVEEWELDHEKETVIKFHRTHPDAPGIKMIGAKARTVVSVEPSTKPIKCFNAFMVASARCCPFGDKLEWTTITTALSTMIPRTISPSPTSG